TDDTVERVSREFPDVEVQRVDHNRGYGYAVNLAGHRAHTDYLAVVNQDAVGTPGWIESLVDALDQDVSAAAANPKILLRTDPRRLNTCANAPNYTGITLCRGYNQPATHFVRTEVVGAISGAAFVVRRDAFLRIGGFDPAFFLYLEDTDLSLRLALAGYHCRYVPDASVLHEFTPSFTAR